MTYALIHRYRLWEPLISQGDNNLNHSKNNIDVTGHCFRYCTCVISLNPSKNFVRWVLYEKHFVGVEIEAQRN